MAKKKKKDKKIQMEEIEIPALLNRYKDWVKNGKIQFLKKNSPEQKKILSCIKELNSEFEKAEKIGGDFSKDLDWYETHQRGRELWKVLASYALKYIDETSKGNSKLFDFIEAATRFEELLYGLEPYYRDHTLHSLWVYLIGEHLQRDCLPNMYKNTNWYLFNDIERDHKEYNYDKKLVKEAEKKEKQFCAEVNKKKDAIWCLMALCHDLGYSLAKLNNLNDRVKDVLEFFDLPEFQRIGYSLDIEQQYNVSQFLELMAMDVRIEPSENLRDEKVESKEKVLIKGYRENSTYWRLCRAFEQKKHGILSAYLIYKILGIFADSWIRDPAEKWGFDDSEVIDNIIRGDILFGIAQHDFEFAYLYEIGSLADILILADELEEFSRYGRQLRTRKYHDTIANSKIKFKPKNPAQGKDIEIDILYTVKKDADSLSFFKRKAKRLCHIYSLELYSQKQDQDGNKSCKIKSIKMAVNNDKGEEYSFTLNRDSIHKGSLPRHNNNNNCEYDLCFRDDELYVCIKDKEIALNEWSPDQEY